jgi:flagellar biosynthesis protein FliP
MREIVSLIYVCVIFFYFMETELFNQWGECEVPNEWFFSKTSNINDNVRFVLDQHTYLDFIVLAHWNSLWVTSFTNIILILSQTVFALTH